jgi:hypothetical protein
MGDQAVFYYLKVRVFGNDWIEVVQNTVLRADRHGKETEGITPQRLQLQHGG